MGVSIYIKKSAINVLSTEKALVHSGCYCGAMSEEGTYCEMCSSTAKDHYETYCIIEGLDLVMTDFQDMVYHVANTWGRSREPILDFIRTKGIASEDWYEG